ncbi:peroxiredoxin-like 2C [Aplysia californica]|uniref:Peroxiredoxin-like 2C n=1 Tax=Aplysia californica TaxID=6500 RepID=A0ABM0JVC8_APLCA|nr:peroxiredoxin-like 2C [Aplysia californica]XP_005102405.1 peroxiredoxin-like 2C [Aplysia californica]
MAAASTSSPPAPDSASLPSQSSMTNGSNYSHSNSQNTSKRDNPYDPEEPDIVAVENVDSLKMSRGVRPEAEINWEMLNEQFVFDEMGNKIRFTDIFKKQKTIVLFVRHFLDFIAKEYVEDVAIIPLEYLQNADVRLVVIGPAPHNYIKAFKELTKLQYTLYVDPERLVYKAMGCKETIAPGGLANSKHIKSGFVSGVASSVWRAMTSPVKEFQGDPKQQGAAFIIGPGNEVHFSHIDQESADHCPLNDILAQAGVMNVSFPRDPRVQIM